MSWEAFRRKPAEVKLRSRWQIGTAVSLLTLLGSAALTAAPAPKRAAPAAPKPASRKAPARATSSSQSARPGTPVKQSAPTATAAPSFSAEDLEFFEKKVRPVLVESCYSCHSAKLSTPLGGLRVDSRAALLKGGDIGPAVVPGDPDKSLLIRAVGYEQRELQMPPKGKLPAEQIEALREWVRRGAPWPAEQPGAPAGAGAAVQSDGREKHWSFQPLLKVAVPRPRTQNWVRTPIDAFILSRLEAQGITPAKSADRLTWLRRVTYDLTGLPPTVAEIQAFQADRSPRAEERVVERLLASPHYGERWARHWLDLVRYAETDGHEFDFEKPDAWQYRDYVIRAFNRDVPYDQFVREHLAGDLLTTPRRHPDTGWNESIIGTGFYWLGEGKHSPVDLKEDEMERIDNQIDVLTKSFLGLTVGCARCHDHKFDPISAADYYALSGFLKSSRYDLAAVNAPEPFAASVRELEALQARMGPVLRGQTARLAEARVAALTQTLLSSVSGSVRLAAVQDVSPSALPTKLREAAGKDPAHPLHAWAVLSQTPPEQFERARRELTARLRELTQRSEAAVAASQVYADFSGADLGGWTVTDQAFGTAPVALGLTPVTGSAVQVPAPVGTGVAHSGRLSVKLQGTLRSPTFTIDKKRILYRMAGQGAHVNLIIQNFQRIRDPLYGYLRIPLNNPRVAWYEQDVSQFQGMRAYIEVVDYRADGWAALDQVLFTDAARPPATPNPFVVRLLEDETITSWAKLVEQTGAHLEQTAREWANGRLEPTPDAVARLDLLAGWLNAELPGAAGLNVREEPLAGLLHQWREAEARVPQPTRVMAAIDGTPENDHLHIRGSHKTLGDVVPRRSLEILSGKQQPAPKQGSGRLELANRWIAHPLLARVIVNRVWHHHFGEGLVRTPDDFGTRGEKPTHPELLDWLSAEFKRQGWSLKALHRMIVLSSTYRMASEGDAKAAAKDPQNRLWHRMMPRRLEAEAVRDGMLAVSGRLDRKLYGPSILPHLTPFMEGRGRPGQSGPLDGEGRRSIYINVRRNFLTPMFLAFDYPIPFTTIGKRSVSTVPAQALILMNNPFVVQQAGYWGRLVLEMPNLSDRDRVQRMYLEAYCRLATDKEVEAALHFLAEQGRQYGTPDDPRAWGDLGHVLFNVKEYIFIP